MRRILAGGKPQRDALRAYLGERLDAKPRMHGEHETVPRWIVRDDAERQWFLEQPAAAHRLVEERRRIDDRRLELAARHGVREDRRAARHAQPRLVALPGTAADRDADVAVAVVRLRRIAGDVQPDLPQELGADEIGALRQRFHAPPKEALKKRRIVLPA